jgi:5-methylcytosine-specific restriction endonuclease McrA
MSTINARNCRTCGRSFSLETTRERKGHFLNYCSINCKKISRRASSSKWQRKNYKPAQPTERKCKECGASFIAKGRSICSARCRKQRARKCVPEYNYMPRDPRKTICPLCNTDFLVQGRGKNPKYCPGCSDLGRKADRSQSVKIERRKGTVPRSKPRKRAKHYGVQYEPVNPFEIFKRDDWTCQICEVYTPRKLRGTSYDLAPELDHIVPISKGGPHTIDNLQCSCRKCNIDKGNKIK